MAAVKIWTFYKLKNCDANGSNCIYILDVDQTQPNYYIGLEGIYNLNGR